ncbi:hypothetical protein ACIQVE_15085 [Pseudomonas sp. NPDC098747]|uniref:hypothetical protein n=1 Tax=Pseudomonas sp. NPDC098747 TaxID=3364487 RepID=UPI00383AC6C7
MNEEIIPSSDLWHREFTPYVDGRRVRWPDVALNLSVGDVCTLTLDYEYSYLIGQPESRIGLYYLAGEDGLGLIFDPPLEQLIEMPIGTTSVSWTITAQNAPSNAFVLQFGLPRVAGLPRSPPVLGTVWNLAQELDVKFDEFDVAFAGNAFPCLGAKHRLTVRPKPFSHLLNKPIKLQWEKAPGENSGVKIAPDLGREELLTLEGKTWELDCLNSTQRGDFSLQITLVEWGVTSSLLAMSLAHNLVWVKRWTTPEFSWPDMNWNKRHIQATSVFSGKLAEGVPVNKAGSSQTYKHTNSLGEAATDIASQGGGGWKFATDTTERSFDTACGSLCNKHLFNERGCFTHHL